MRRKEIKVMKILNDILTKLTLGKMKKVEIPTKKRTILNEVMENPEDFKLEAFIENDEIIFKVKRKEEHNEEI